MEGKENLLPLWRMHVNQERKPNQALAIMLIRFVDLRKETFRRVALRPWSCYGCSPMQRIKL